MIATLVKPVPVVPRHPYHVTDLELHLEKSLEITKVLRKSHCLTSP